MTSGTRDRGGRLKAAARIGAGWLLASCLLVACTAAPTEETSPSRSVSGYSVAPPSPPDADFDAVERDLTRALTEGDPVLGHVRSVLVSVAGETVIEYYHQRTADDHAHVWSVTKSVISVLVGIAVDEGLLQVDQTLAELLPEHASVMTEAQKTITLQQLLTMTAGFPAEDGGLSAEAEDTVQLMLLYGLMDEPGVTFSYSNSSAHLVAAVLRRAVDRPILDYAREKLFDPLGIDTSPAWEGVDLGPAGGFDGAGFAWATDRSGVHMGPWGLKLTSPDLVKLGELCLNDGRWQGKELVSSDWVRASTWNQLNSDQQGSGGAYGYFWWVADIEDHPAFIAMGSYFQRIYVIPARQTVIVVTADVGDDGAYAEADRATEEIAAALEPVLNEHLAPLMQ